MLNSNGLRNLKGVLKNHLVRAGIGIPARNWFGKSNSRTNLKTAKASFCTPQPLFQQSLKIAATTSKHDYDTASSWRGGEVNLRRKPPTRSKPRQKILLTIHARLIFSFCLKI